MKDNAARLAALLAQPERTVTPTSNAAPGLLTDLMSMLPAPQPVTGIDTRVTRPATVEVPRLMKVLDRYAEEAAWGVENWPGSIAHEAVRDAMRDLILDILDIL